MQIDQFVPNFDMAYKIIKRVSVPNLKWFGPTKQSYGQKKFENFLLCGMGKWPGVVLLPTNVAVWRFSKL